MRYGKWGDGEIKIGMNVANVIGDAGGMGNATVVAESHTHPFIGNAQSASNSDLATATTINTFLQYTPRHLLIGDGVLREYW